MAGGNSHIRVNAGYGTLGVTSVIDANSARAGNMTEPINIGGKTVWVTPEGAQGLKDYQDGVESRLYRLSVESDTKTTGIWGFRSKESNLPANKPEQHIGDPTAKE